MPRISQQLASQIATKLVANKRTTQSELQLEFREYFTVISEKRVPKEVAEFFKKHSEYVKTTSSLYVDGKGFNRLNISLTRALPSISPNCYYEHLDLTEAEATKGKKLYNAWQKSKENNDELENEIENSLLNLRSFSNIEKHLPEAAGFLPKQGLTVIVDTEELRKKLK